MEKFIFKDGIVQINPEQSEVVVVGKPNWNVNFRRKS